MEKSQIETPQEPISCDDENFHLAIPLGNGVTLEMIKVKAGTFMMGSPEDELGRWHDETLHKETLTQDYWLGKFPVTQAQFEAVADYNPSYRKGDNLPVEGLLRDDIRYFCDELNEKYADKLPKGYVFDLPSEAQWEYACRAGCSSALNNGTEITRKYGRCWNLGDVAWNPLDKVDYPQPVGKKAPNNWGIYDMHGNVWEWCLDHYIHITKKGVLEEFDKNYFVIRGGAYNSYPKFCRAACITGRHESREMSEDFYRIMYKDQGFRVVLNRVK